MDWDDLRYVLAVSRAGGLNGAARQLGVNPSSVFRRLGALEQQLEVRLFERLREGYRLTPAGEAFAESAARVEAETTQVERKLKGIDTRLEGTIRLNTSDLVAQFLVPRWLGEFQRTFPGLTLDITTAAEYVDLSKREVDVVIRGTASPPEHLVGRSTARMGMAAYASKRYLDRAGRDRALDQHDWLDFLGAMRRAPMARWMEANVPDRCVKLRFDSSSILREALLADLGCALLPCATCDENPELERLPGTHFLSSYHVWLLTHPDLRRSARIHAFLDFFSSRFTASASLLTGEAPRLRKMSTRSQRSKSRPKRRESSRHGRTT
ncbi:MAG TPA: LysR family transcriptional regulator [Nevskiaceae bacterium]|nr:LysR family transcriptional regulator [Nevskiaceae bacterium]